MDLPTVLLPILEQGNRSLEDHTKDFMYLASMTHYPRASPPMLSGCWCPADLSWTTEDDTSPTPDSESSQPSPRFAEHESEPTVDGEPEPSVTESSPCGATGLRIAQEPEPLLSDQVRESATEPATVDVPDGREGAEDSTAHCTTAEGEQRLDLGLIVLEQDLTNFVEDIYEDMPALLPPSKLPVNLEQI
ncbi:hypothetical protein H4Q32_003383 [Labeo rohita]|uniref:Uncharacterized protein n=1 Tax=Labeo rohita TaxID=84645 RepID=A0ABQ8MQD0_LABRO|nr:hypothetical protein H4Q32_003383 [Labeo rohita]